MMEVSKLSWQNTNLLTNGAWSELEAFSEIMAKLWKIFQSHKNLHFNLKIKHLKSCKQGLLDYSLLTWLDKIAICPEVSLKHRFEGKENNIITLFSCIDIKQICV